MITDEIPLVFYVSSSIFKAKVLPTKMLMLLPIELDWYKFLRSPDISILTKFRR